MTDLRRFENYGRESEIPNHVAIILDGNGRWAKAKGMPCNYGHMQGAKTVEVICEEAYRMGIQYLTVYAFFYRELEPAAGRSGRADEAAPQLYEDLSEDSGEETVCVSGVLGDKTRLDQDIRTRIAELEEATKNNDGLHFQIAINYGGRDEIIRAVKKTVRKSTKRGSDHRRPSRRICWKDYLDTAGIPDPDLLIRTCNEQRISNFLLWQLAYTEFYFTRFPGRILQKKN